MSDSYLINNLQSKNLPAKFIKLCWQFIKNENCKEFEQFIYYDDIAPKLFNPNVYEFIVLIDFDDFKETQRLRRMLLDLLRHYPLKCLCPTMPKHTMFSYQRYPDYEPLNKHINSLERKFKIQSFSGEIKNFYNYYYHEAEIVSCNKCGTHWFQIFEESFCDFYMIRLNEEKYNILTNNRFWPNDLWPTPLRNWDEFLKSSFTVWDDMYLAENCGLEQQSFNMKLFLDTDNI